MKAFARYSIALAFVYVLCWTLAYVFIMGLDFHYYFQYFRLGWSFRGLEYPAFIWGISFGLFLILSVPTILILRRKPKEKSL